MGFLKTTVLKEDKQQAEEISKTLLEYTHTGKDLFSRVELDCGGFEIVSNLNTPAGELKKGQVVFVLRLDPVPSVSYNPNIVIIS